MERNTEQNGMEWNMNSCRNGTNMTKSMERNKEHRMEHLKQNVTEYFIQILFLIQIISTVKAPTSDIRGQWRKK